MAKREMARQQTAKLSELFGSIGPLAIGRDTLAGSQRQFKSI